jgi:integrase
MPQAVPRVVVALEELARFMLATGLRLGEALGVTWADVDLTTGTVSVTRTIVRIKGRGLVATRIESKASERGLLLPPWCVELLRARRVRRGGFDGPVFPGARGGWRDRSNVGKAFSRVSMTQDVYLGRRASNSGNLAALEAYNPDLAKPSDEPTEQE